MSETSVKELLQEAMAGQEPPIGQQILGNAVRAARRTRRRQWTAGIGAAAAMVPALAFGVPALAGALSPAAGHGGGGAPGVPQSGSSPDSASTHSATKAPAAGGATVKARAIKLVRPVLPAGNPDGGPVPITKQSLGQLLIDDMPADAHLGQIEANVNAGALWSSSFRIADAWLENVVTPTGAGAIQASLMDHTSGYFGQECPSGSAAGDACTVYHLAGGVIVVEDYTADSQNGGLHKQLFVTVFRPGVGNFSINESNSAMRGGSALNANMPLTAAQMVKAAMDPRWQFTISQSFVQQASGLQVAPLDTAGS